MTEARLDNSGSGLAPAEAGWFVMSVRDAQWFTSETFGSVGVFDGVPPQFRQIGINVRVIEPGQPNCLYHSESEQEALLVLSGECRLLVENEERILRQWDFFHCPPGTEHVCVGEGDRPAVVLMIGARDENKNILYPVSELAGRYGASSELETGNPQEAYAPFDRPAPAKPACWEQLPFA